MKANDISFTTNDWCTGSVAVLLIQHLWYVHCIIRHLILSLLSSPGLQCTLTELQRREVVLLGQVGELESRLKLVQRSSDRAELAVTETRKQLSREQV